MNQKPNRRDMLKTTGIAAAGIVGGNAILPNLAEAKTEEQEKSRVLTVAHITDVHIQPERSAEEWLAECFHHIQSQKPTPDFILNSGDSVMDSLDDTKDRVKTLWECWKRTVKNECSLKMENCIGNHDVWGWGMKEKEKEANQNDPLWGKAWAMESLGLKSRYRSFDKKGWHFILLDSTGESEKSAYIAKLDEEQFLWFKKDLESTPTETPVLIISHIPILAACAFFDGENEKTGRWTIPGQWVHIDARKIKDLFLEHSNVKLCLSGHIHLKDRVDYNNITYLCNGAVCGSWWKGNYQETPPGYALVHLFNDGTFDYSYETYGWK